FLFLLPLVPLLAWWRLRHRRPALRFSDARLIAGLPPGRARHVRRLDAVLHAAALLALVVALAGPRRPLATRIPIEGIAIVLAVEQGRPLDESQTNIGDAIAESLLRLDEAGERRKVMILLSDGEHNFPGPETAKTWTPRLAAQRAKDLGVPIYAIDAGSDAGA